MSSESTDEYSIVKQLQIAKCLLISTQQLRCAIIKSCDFLTIEFFADLAFNFLKGNIDCTRHQFLCLKKYRKLLKKLASNCYGSRKFFEESIKRKRRLLCRIKDSLFWNNFLSPVVGNV